MKDEDVDVQEEDQDEDVVEEDETLYIILSMTSNVSTA